MNPPPRPPKIWWPGQGPFRTKIPKIHWEEAATQTIGKLAGFQARFSPELSPRILAKTKVLAWKPSIFPVKNGGSSGENLGWNPPPHFPYGFLSPGWSGAQIPKFGEDPPPGHQKFGDLPRVPLGPKFPKSIGRRRPPKPPRPKVTIGQLGGFSAQIFPRALPKDFWQQRKCWLESPQSSLWFPLAWVILGPKTPQIYWEARPQ